jgi:hypothetical protein
MRNIIVGAIYFPRFQTEFPYEIWLVEVKNGIAYFFVETAGIRIGNMGYKLELELFNNYFYISLDRSKPLPFGIKTEAFVPLEKSRVFDTKPSIRVPRTWGR